MSDTNFIDETTVIEADWLNDVNDHVYNSTPVSPATTVHPASVIANTPAGNIAATTVQDALNELDTEKATVAAVQTAQTTVDNHIADTSAAHVASAISFTPAVTGGVPTTVASKLGEAISVLDFGAVADGIDTGTAFTGTDNTTAFQTALDYCGLNRKTLFIPSGKYYFAPLIVPDTGRLTLNYSYHAITGEGLGVTELLIDDDITTARSLMDFIRTPNIGASISRTLRESLQIVNLAFRGRWTHSPANAGGTHIINVQNFAELALTNIAAFDIRGKLSRSAYLNSVRVENSRFERIGSDCLRFVDANHVVIVNNILKWMDDDAIALPAPSTVTSAERTSISIVGNHLEQCESVLVLGAKNISVTANTFKFSKSSAIYIGGQVGTEGSTQTESLTITGNSIIDPIMRYFSPSIATQTDGNAAITVSGMGMSSVTTAGVYPGNPVALGTSFVDPRGADSAGSFLMYNYDGTVKSIPPAYNFIVANNTIMRTLPPVAAFSSWGHGLMFSAASGWVDPAVAITNFQKHGIMLNSDCQNVGVNANTVMGFPNGSGVYLQKIASTPDNELAFNNILIGSNVITDCMYGVSHNLVSSATTVPFSWTIAVKNNLIDCDPYHTSAARTSPLDGSWQAGIGVLSRPIGVIHRQSNGWIIEGNVIANAYDGILGNAKPEFALSRNNTLICDPAVVGFSTSNKGIGDIGYGGGVYNHQVTMCDPRPQSAKTVTLTRSSLVVTATSTAHGLSVGQSIIIAGAVEAGYNGQWFITTVPTADTFTYNITSAPATPATGTITATQVYYGKHIFSPLFEKTSVPIDGKYVTGHFVRNSAPVTASSKTTLGWVRQSIGTEHTVATTTTADWAPIVATTS